MDTAHEYDIVTHELDEPTCWGLLVRAGLGRIGVVQHGEVVVLPVNAAVVDRHVVFRTNERSSLAATPDGTVVAFEADQTETVAESGWSVLVRGRLRRVTDPHETARLAATGLHPWAPVAGDCWMAITPVRVTGRMIERHRIVPQGDHVPYMPPD